MAKYNYDKYNWTIGYTNNKGWAVKAKVYVVGKEAVSGE